MKPLAFYNENDPKTAAWLRELIKEDLIADGVVDERSITEIKAHELRDFTQVHCFAGIGGWSYSLRLAGWPDNKPCWTASCPCQPFSNAGVGLGFEDSRHLWPVFRELVRECNPPVVFGEQVASSLGREWLTGVLHELEKMDYWAAGADLCAAGVGAPHVRSRLYWVAHSTGAGRCWRDKMDGREFAEFGRSGEDVRVADPHHERHNGVNPLLRPESSGGGAKEVFETPRSSETRRVANARYQYRRRWTVSRQPQKPAPSNRRKLGDPHTSRLQGAYNYRGVSRRVQRHTPQSGWGDSELIECRDGKYRRIEPGTFPLAHGVSERVVRLRSYGNAIVPPLAAAFILACEEAIQEMTP